MIETNPDDLEKRLVQLTRDLVMIPSSAERPTDIERAIELVRHHVDDLPQLDLRILESQGHLSLLAMPTASPLSCDVMLCAHVDVVSHSDAAVLHPEIRGNRIIGPGAGDMKGQLAILISLFAAVHRHRPGSSLGLVVTSDEEIGGMNGIRYLLGELGLRCDVAIIPDGGSLVEFPAAEKGILHARVTITGASAHAARPWLGSNALLRGAALITRFAELFPKEPDVDDDHWYPTCTPTMMTTTNHAINRIPDEVQITLDCRFPKPYTAADIEAQLASALSSEDTLEVLISAEASTLNPDEHFLRIAEQVAGTPARRIREAGGSDGRFFADLGIPVVISRPLVGNLHDRDEWIDVPSMLQYYEITATYLNQRLLGATPTSH